MGGSILIVSSSNDGVLSLNVEITMTKAKKLRKPIIGFMIFEDFTEDMSDWQGMIAYPDPTGANLSWENPIKMIEAKPLIEELRAVRGCLEAYKKYSGFPEYASETLTKLDSLIKEIENE